MNLNQGYSFTLTIPYEKRVYYSGKRRKYGSLTQKQQWYFLCDLMTKSTWITHFDFIDYVFEEHGDGRLHIHGYAIVNHLYQDIGAMERLVDNFYTVNSIVNIKMSVYLSLSNIQRTYKDKQYWFDYMEKNQDNIIFKSHYQTEKDDNEKLDKGVVRIHTRAVSPPPEYYDTYRFTGETNKFFVEI